MTCQDKPERRSFTFCRRHRVKSMIDVGFDDYEISVLLGTLLLSGDWLAARPQLHEDRRKLFKEGEPVFVSVGSGMATSC